MTGANLEGGERKERKRRRRLVQRQSINQNPTRVVWGGRGCREKSNDTMEANF